MFLNRKKLGREIPKRPRALKFVSVNRRTCSLSNAAENVQHRNFVSAFLPVIPSRADGGEPHSRSVNQLAPHNVERLTGCFWRKQLATDCEIPRRLRGSG